MCTLMTAPADAPHPAWAWGTAAAAWGEARDNESRFGPSECSMSVDTCLEVTFGRWSYWYNLSRNQGLERKQRLSKKVEDPSLPNQRGH